MKIDATYSAEFYDLITPLIDEQSRCFNSPFTIFYMPRIIKISKEIERVRAMHIPVKYKVLR